jgi:pimeloyl-ACP methyl ester carboxylesterase
MKSRFANAIPRTVDVTDSVFSFREIGDVAGTPLIFLNHLSGDLEDWDPAFVDGLAAHHRIIIFDYRAAGGISRMAFDAIKFIGALGLKLVDLVGFSMGAFVAQRIVHERPDLVRRVFLAGAVPPDADFS